MGKKQRHPNSSPASQAAPSDLERQAQAELEAGRFRKARDLYKLLCKENRASYLPGLIEANRGLAAQLTEKGQVSEAAQVIAYLKTLVPAEELLGMEVAAAQRAQDWPRVLCLAAELWKAVGGVPGPRDRATVADALVLAYPNLQEEEVALDGTLKLELSGLLEAMRAVAEQRFEDAQNLLRPLPRNSIFADWKILVKGWIAFYTGDLPKAGALFALLPEPGLPARAASAFRPFLGGHEFPSGIEREMAIRRTCQLLGEPSLGTFLARADQLWHGGRHLESLREMRRAPAFPSEALSLAGALSDFYFRAAGILSGDAYDRYVSGLLKIADAMAFRSEAEARFFWRALASDALEQHVPEFAEEWWRDFLEALPPEEPRRPALSALVFAKLGNWATQPAERSPLLFNSPGATMRDPRAAMRVLEESIRYDPRHLPAYRDLLKVYEHEKKTDQHERLLTKMAERFPEDKTVLLQVGHACLERAAHAKGIEALQRANALDRLDPAILRELVHGHLALARQQYQKKHLAQAREMFTALEAYTQETLDLDRGLQMVRARQAALEFLFGEEAAGRRWLAAALASPPGAAAALLLIAHGYYRLCDKARRQKTPFWNDLKAIRIGTAEERAQLFAAFEYARAMSGQPDWEAEAALVSERLAPIAGSAFTREEASRFHPLLAAKPEFQKLARKILQSGLRNDPRDPRFLLFAEMAKKGFPQRIDRKKIEAIRDAASRLGDTQTALKASEILAFRISLLSPFDGDDDFEEEEGEFSSPGGFDPDEIEEMKRQAEKLTDAEFAAFRKKSARYIPLEIFDLLIGTRGKKGKKAASSAARDPSQLDLF